MVTKPTNLFATTTVKTTAKKVADKKFIQAPVLGEKIKRFLLLKDEIEAFTAELKMLEGDIKEVGRDEYLKEFKKARMKPESFKLQDATGAACLFMAMDKYTTVDEGKFEVLSGFDGLVESKNTFTVSPDMIEKYGEVLSKLIMGSKAIADEDKGQIIKGETVYSIAKGSIDRLLQYDQPETIFALINPICALKK